MIISSKYSHLGPRSTLQEMPPILNEEEWPSVSGVVVTNAGESIRNGSPANVSRVSRNFQLSGIFAGREPRNTGDHSSNFSSFPFMGLEFARFF